MKREEWSEFSTDECGIDHNQCAGCGDLLPHRKGVAITNQTSGNAMNGDPPETLARICGDCEDDLKEFLRNHPEGNKND